MHSKILSLWPIWDEESGLIKVGGRVSKAKLPEPRKHQVILPGNDIFTKRLFEMEHLKLTRLSSVNAESSAVSSASSLVHEYKHK